ncbi:unnamed protein product [Oppiella nova]|uniref:lysozyme n=1 Tax=Oppiella nova TaxID=334625 RepID=A0A7R9M099_9ACAR|nr:unnamed protein product [Oppiella nova]CAG2168684.1 unnamed protein product [Oppiella nova]
MFWESGLDTKAHRIGNFDGSSNYGILQISDLMWCQANGRKNNTNFCDSSCDKFRDSDITDDMKCALLIYKLQGFDAWGTYNTRCHSDNNHYTEGCNTQNLTPKEKNSENSEKALIPSIKDTKKKSSLDVEKNSENSEKALIPSIKDTKKKSSLVKQLLEMSKTSMNLPERMFRGINRRSIANSTQTKPQNKAKANGKPNASKSDANKKVVRSQVNNSKDKGLKRTKRGLLGQDSINPFEDARIFVFNPLCCFNWKAADVEWSNAKNW